MKTYRISKAGRIRAGLLLVVLAVIFLYTGRKAIGLWSGITAKPTDPLLFNLNLNTTVPAFFLTLLALGCLGVAWYVVVEMLSEVRVDESGILVFAPGYRLFYRWNEITSIDVLHEPEEDTAACLRVETSASAPRLEPAQPETGPDEIAAYLSEADLREDRATRRRQQQTRRQQVALVRSRATRPDGRPVPVWLRLLYPQARRPDRLLLYPSLDDRAALVSEIEQHLARA